MDGAGALEAATLHGGDPAAAMRERAQSVAHQFEDVLVRSLVAAMRQTASVGGESGGMFGGEPGADTYADWFDEHLAKELGRSGKVGVADVLMREFERWKQIPADTSVLHHRPLHALPGGGLDVAL
jgi:Rod binding domain-containing protein